MADRPLRFCDACGGLDDHPRHVIDGVANGKPPADVLAGFDLSGAPASAVEQLFAPNVTVRHMDCCAAAGCPVCQATEALTGGARGDKLLTTIQGGALDDFEPPDVPASMTGGDGG